MQFREGIPYGDVANVLNCNIIVSEFKLQSQYNVIFRTNTLVKSMNSFIPQQLIK